MLATMLLVRRVFHLPPQQRSPMAVAPGMPGGQNWFSTPQSQPWQCSALATGDAVHCAPRSPAPDPAQHFAPRIHLPPQQRLPFGVAPGVPGAQNWFSVPHDQLWQLAASGIGVVVHWSRLRSAASPTLVPAGGSGQHFEPRTHWPLQHLSPSDVAPGVPGAQSMFCSASEHDQPWQT